MADKKMNNLRINLLTWIERFVASPHLKRKTRLLYRYTILQFVLYVEKISGKENFFLATVKRGTITAWLKKMRKSHPLETVTHRARVVNRFLSFLEENGCLAKNPLVQLQKKYPKKGLKGIILAFTGPSPQKFLQTLKSSPRFASPFGPPMQKFIALGRAQGKVYRAEEYICVDSTIS